MISFRSLIAVVAPIFNRGTTTVLRRPFLNLPRAVAASFQLDQATAFPRAPTTDLEPPRAPLPSAQISLRATIRKCASFVAVPVIVLDTSYLDPAAAVTVERTQPLSETHLRLPSQAELDKAFQKRKAEAWVRTRARRAKAARDEAAAAAERVARTAQWLASMPVAQRKREMRQLLRTLRMARE